MTEKRVARAPLSDLLSSLPSVDRLVTHARAGDLIKAHGRDEVLRAVRNVLEITRTQLRSGDPGGLATSTTDDALLAALLDQASVELAARAPEVAGWTVRRCRRCITRPRPVCQRIR